MKTFINQINDDEVITLPFEIAQEVIEKMKVNSKCVIHKITNHFENGILKQTIKHYYN